MQNIISRWVRPIGSCFLAGLLAILPVVLTLLIVAWVAGFIQTYIGPGSRFGEALASLGLRLGSDGWAAYAVGWVVVLVTVFLLGVLVQFGARRLFQWMMDALLLRIPLVGRIYGTSKQLVEMFDRKPGSDPKG
jgi:uncharacterized membrane protein